MADKTDINLGYKISDIKPGERYLIRNGKRQQKCTIIEFIGLDAAGRFLYDCTFDDIDGIFMMSPCDIITKIDTDKDQLKLDL